MKALISPANAAGEVCLSALIAVQFNSLALTKGSWSVVAKARALHCLSIVERNIFTLWISVCIYESSWGLLIDRE